MAQEAKIQKELDMINQRDQSEIMKERGNGPGASRADP